MTQQRLFSRIDDRIALDKEEGDYAYFRALCLKLEFITKVVTAGVVACIGDDVDRHRYSLEYKLVRADSIGVWVEVLHQALIGRPAQFFDSGAQALINDLKERVGPQDWRHSAVTNLDQAALEVGAETQLGGGKVALRQFFDIGAQLRNRSRAHGATTNDQCSRACSGLADGLDAVVAELGLFKLPWAYLHRSSTRRKYRVSPLLGDTSPFDYLKRERNIHLPNGVFLYLGRPVHVPLVFSDSDVLDIALPNGNHKRDTFETLSYVTNETVRQDGSAWSDPPSRLPKSVTEGDAVLGILGNTFANVPSKAYGHIPRPDLEDHLQEELLKSDRHPIISLTGPGGIGKTAIAIAAIHGIAEREDPPYNAVLWISARDIDLLESGPKPVSPRAVTQQDISRTAVELLNELLGPPSGSPDVFFQNCLTEGAVGPTLFVLDNFETVQSPADVFRWIDTYIRPPNKVLITSRIQDFVGDYSIKIGGMTDEQAHKLVDQHAARLGITALLDSAYKEELISEADRHPYAMKILLGQVKKEGRAVRPQRIVASASTSNLLRTLFERTYGALSLDGQRVFLLLCSWKRAFVPEVAVEAVSLRPGTERFDVAEALQELYRFSLADKVFSKVEGEEEEAFVYVPLTAAIYGRSRLKVSPFRVEIEEDRKHLMEFGVGRREDADQGIRPRIDNLFRAVARQVSIDPTALTERLPVLESLAARAPRAYLRLADLVWDQAGDSERAKEYLRRYLASAPPPEQQSAWLRLAELCQSSQDPAGEVHALSEAALLVASDQEALSDLANRLNNRINSLKSRSFEDDWPGRVQGFLGQVIGPMERHFNQLSATDCSRLAWLHLNAGNQERALDVARLGLERDPTNRHCKNLVQKLEG